MDLQLSGRRAFVAAASKGLGRAIALELCREGADVAICSRDERAINAAAEELRAHGTRVVASVADVTDAGAIATAVNAAAGELGGLDILVVNAGGPPGGTFDRLTDDTWHSAFDLTFMSATRLIRTAVPHLQQSGVGSIVVVSSTSVARPISGLLLSNSLRRAVSGLVIDLATELAPAVRINSILPGRIVTDRTLDVAKAEARGGDPQAVMAEGAKTIPLRRYGDTEELARVAAFLASPAASYVTGVELAVDGGALAAPR